MVQEKFYALTASEFEKINSLLTNAELKVYLYLMTLNPFGDRKLEVDTAYLSERLGLNRRTIQRAINRLEKLELIEVEISKFRYVKKCCESDETIHPATRRSIQRRDDPLSDETIHSATRRSTQRRDDPQNGSPDRQRTPEPSPSKDSEPSKTIQTYTDFIQTFSEGEREEFFNSINKRQRQYLDKNWQSFIDRCLSECDRMPNPPTLPETFIRKHFLEMARKFIRSAPLDVAEKVTKKRPKHPYFEKIHRLAEEARRG